MTVDGSVVWDKDYTSASAYTDEVVFVSVFQREDGKYVYHLSDIPFNSSIKVVITNTDTVNSLTLDLIFAKYEAG